MRYAACVIVLLLYGGSAYAASPFMSYDQGRTKHEIAEAVRTGNGLNFETSAYVLLLQSVTGQQFNSAEEAAHFIESDAVTIASCNPDVFGEREVYGARDRSHAVLHTRGCNTDQYVLMYNGEPFLLPRCGNPIVTPPHTETRASHSCEWVTERGATDDQVIVGNSVGVVGAGSSVTSTLSYCR